MQPPQGTAAKKKQRDDVAIPNANDPPFPPPSSIHHIAIWCCPPQRSRTRAKKHAIQRYTVPLLLPFPHRVFRINPTRNQSPFSRLPSAPHPPARNSNAQLIYALHLSHHVLLPPWRMSARFASSYLTSPHVTLPYLTLPYLALPCLTLPYLTLPYLTFYLTLPCHVAIRVGGARRFSH